MNRFEKKCLLASSGFHGFLLLLLVFGSAFFVAKERPITTSRLQFVPSRFVESALAGGGGNPNIPRSDDVQSGSPTAPVPPPNARVTDKAPAQPAIPTPPPPKPEPKKPEPKVEAPKPTPVPAAKQPTPKPVELTKPKPAEKTPQAKPRIDLSELKPVDRTQADKKKAQAEAEAREAARQTAAANATRQRIAKQIGDAAAAMQRGFASGTKVEVGGPGGEAYADYASTVQAIYEAAWIVLPDLNDNDAVAFVRVTVDRSGKVIESRIVRKSNSAIMDKSVQRALDRVRSEGLPPFPAFLKDAERTFDIEFNLKAKRLG